MKLLTIGSDPEFFLEKDGKIVSSVGLVGGTKEENKRITDLCYVHEDNVAIELTFPPAYDSESFYHHLSTSMSDSIEYMKGYSLSNKASHEFTSEELDNDSSREFGCNPDYNALTGERNGTPFSDTNLRCCGGHVSLGYENPSEETNKRIVLLLDIFLGVPSILLDTDDKRRTLYGKASSYRNKPFGLEYRVLSNFWVFERKYIEWVYNTCSLVMSIVESGVSLGDNYILQAINIINTHDKAKAKSFIKKHYITLP